MAQTVLYDSLDAGERLRRVGVLLCKAATLARIREETLSDVPQRTATSSSSQPHPAQVGQILPECSELIPEELALIERLVRLGPMSPQEITHFFGLSRTTSYRRIQRLERAGWIAKSGATRATRYLLTEAARARLKQMKPI